MTFCPYLGCETDESFTKEHIVPRSIGCPDSFSILVSKTGNNNAGRLVDSTLVNSSFIHAERLRLRITAADGVLPKLNMRGTVELDGQLKAALFQHDVLTGETSYDILEQRVEIIPKEGVYQVTFQCDPDHAEVLFRKKLGRLGINFSEEQIAQVLSNIPAAPPTQVPLTVDETIDVTAFDRCFMKMALATAVLVFGEVFARSTDADLLRQFIWEDDLTRRATAPIHGSIWPTLHEPLPYLNEPDQHLVALIRDQPNVVFYASLFGKYAGLILVSNTADQYPWPNEQGLTWVIEPVERTVQEADFTAYVNSK